MYLHQEVLYAWMTAEGSLLSCAPPGLRGCAEKCQKGFAGFDLQLCVGVVDSLQRQPQNLQIHSTVPS